LATAFSTFNFQFSIIPKGEVMRYITAAVLIAAVLLCLWLAMPALPWLVLALCVLAQYEMARAYKTAG